METSAGELTLKLPLSAWFFINDEFLFVRLNTVHGRLAARMFAYSVQASDPEGAKQVLDIVGREA